MNHETFLLATKATGQGSNVRPLLSPAALKAAVHTKHAGANWFVLDTACLVWLHQANVSTKADSLVLLDRPRKSLSPILHARFAKVWAANEGMTFLPKDELVEVINSLKRTELVIGGVVDETEGVVLLLRGNLDVVEAPLAMFHPSGTGTPDFKKFTVVDYGTAVAFGRYVATVDSILYDVDPKYRRLAKKRQLELDDSFGGSVKRLRLLRGLSQAAFEPEVSAKEVARIESGKVGKPHGATLKAMAKKLRVKARDISTY